MKRIILVVVGCLMLVDCFAQSPIVVEANLVKAFNKISYWANKVETDTTSTALESLEKANSDFETILKLNAEKYPFTINNAYLKLSKQVGILTSMDGRLRIYSWDSQMGGTQHDNRNVFQYKWGSKTFALTSTGKNDDGNFDYGCDSLYTMSIGDKNYYLLVGYNELSNFLHGAEIRVFTIEDGKLNMAAKIIKTKQGLTHRLSFKYVTSMDSDGGIIYDSKGKTIIMPLIDANEHITGKFITYKFTGKYFEKVKS